MMQRTRVTQEKDYGYNGRDGFILTSYSAGNPDHPDWFIYEYDNRRKVLVQIDNETGKVSFLREL
ncbi:hypothetical protein [Sphingobacterium suaedae]|uniref:PepSY domain-containing protein n=1 Tax=Sphingobacterium suaedae TaxID=1686402 RepID=A0ABW5KDY9_9SPHI